MKIYRLFLLSALACAPLAQGSELALKVGNHAVSAEVADTPETREYGLMQRTTLCADCGMLFVFPASTRLAFWMKNTTLALSIAFVGSDGRIVNIEEMQPYSLDIHYSASAALYALEMNRGWFATHRVNPGDLVVNLKHAAQSGGAEIALPLPHASR